MHNIPDSIPDITALVERHYPAVVRLALSILDDGCAADALDEAEDAAQETFIAAARGLSEFRASSSAKTWLFAIAINVCRSRLRRRKARRVLARSLAAMQRLFGEGGATRTDAEQQAECAERDRALWAAVDRLERKHRLVVVLHYVHELTAGEIAQTLSISEGTVHSRLHYARQQLAGWMQRTEVSGTPPEARAAGKAKI